MGIDASSIWQLTNALGSKPEDKTNTRLATVSRIDDEGHVWVSIPGGETETPTETTDVEVERGDTVTVEWRNNKLYVLGNSTQPATSVRRVTQIVEPIEETANEAAAGVGKAVDASKAAQQAAAEAAEVAEAVNQHFWYDTNGAHITDATQEAWEEEYAKPDHGELDNPTDAHPWYNQLLGSAGTLLRSGLKNLASWTRSAIAFYDGNGNAAENIVAQFGANGAQIGAVDSTNVNLYVGNDGIELNQGETIVGNIKRELDRVFYKAGGLYSGLRCLLLEGGTSWQGSDQRREFIELSSERIGLYAGGRMLSGAPIAGVSLDIYSVDLWSGRTGIIIRGDGDNNSVIINGTLLVNSVNSYVSNLVLNGKVNGYAIAGAWRTLPLDSNTAAYDAARTPQYRQSAGFCSLEGAVKPVNEVAAGGTLTIGTLPEGYRPKVQIDTLCQGRAAEIYMLRIATNGVVTASRYRNGTGQDIPMGTNAFLSFNVTFGIA